MKGISSDSSLFVVTVLRDALQIDDDGHTTQQRKFVVLTNEREQVTLCILSESEIFLPFSLLDLLGHRLSVKSGVVSCFFVNYFIHTMNSAIILKVHYG